MLGLAGTVRYMVFFVMHVKSRAVEIGGIVRAPTGEWMKQIARNLLDAETGLLKRATNLILDRDPVYVQGFKSLVGASGVKVMQIPAQSPNCNPHAERFVRTIRSECLRHFVIFGERHLRHLVREFVDQRAANGAPTGGAVVFASADVAAVEAGITTGAGAH